MSFTCPLPCWIDELICCFWLHLGWTSTCSKSNIITVQLLFKPKLSVCSLPITYICTTLSGMMTIKSEENCNAAVKTQCYLMRPSVVWVWCRKIITTFLIYYFYALTLKLRLILWIMQYNTIHDRAAPLRFGVNKWWQHLWGAVINKAKSPGNVSPPNFWNSVAQLCTVVHFITFFVLKVLQVESDSDQIRIRFRIGVWIN